ncbi:MAG: L-rhamnose/proton symporter RhaT [Bacteroidota bacterium]
MMKLIGILLAFAGGGLQGAFFFPMKYMRNWRWENGWFLFSVIACFILPTMLAFGTTPGIFELYGTIGYQTIGLVFFFGMCWGVGAVLFGLGADFLGMALGIAIITGINVCLGALLPVLFLPSGQFSTTSALLLGSGLFLMVAGVVVISIAGSRREKEQSVLSDDKSTGKKRSFKLGLIICIVSGVFVPAANFAVFFGQPIAEQLQASGNVADYNIGHAQMLPFFIGGGIVNILYCISLFRKHGSFALYRAGGFTRNTSLAIIMSVLYTFGMLIYVVAVALFIPDIGAAIGWPVFLAATILVSNFLGLVSGEWKKVHAKTLVWLFSGVFLLLIAVTLSSISSLYS